MTCSANDRFDGSQCGRISRRAFLADCGMGFTGLALGSILHDVGIVRASEHSPWHPPTGAAHFAPQAKSVIWLFMLGGTNHLESFDYKPDINRYAEKTFEETPHNEAVVGSPFFRKNARDFTGEPRKLMSKIFPLQVGYKKYGQSGIEVSDWLPHLGEHVDDIAFIRSMWTTDNDHAAQLQFHTGRHVLDGFFPSIGSWVHYGLGSLNENLPQFIALGNPPRDCCGGVAAHGGDYLGSAHAGVQLRVDPHQSLAFGSPGSSVYLEERRQQLDFLQSLNAEAGVAYPDDPEMLARIRSYELAFHAVEDRHYVTDIHATVLQQLGLDPKRLDIPGHKRIEIDYGRPIGDILA